MLSSGTGSTRRPSTVAAEELARLADATVRDFVPIFTWRRSRARIRQQLELAAQEPAEDLSRSA